jgi:hypothetical protein
MAAKDSVHRVLDMPDEVWCVIELKGYFHFVIQMQRRTPTIISADQKESGASGEIRTLKHLFLRQAAIPIRTRWHSGAQGRI